MLVVRLCVCVVCVIVYECVDCEIVCECDVREIVSVLLMSLCVCDCIVCDIQEITDAKRDEFSV